MVVVVVVVLLVPTLVLGVMSGVAVVAFVLPVLLLDTATGPVNDDMTVVVVGTTASEFVRWTAFVRFELVVFLLLLLLLLL